jgi:hypothetical protein
MDVPLIVFAPESLEWEADRIDEPGAKMSMQSP